MTHLEDCLRVFDAGKDLAIHPEEVELALWFHDAIYNPTANNNEQKSAEWAGEVIRQVGLDEGVAERVRQLILATRHNAVVFERDEQLIVDVDLSILGREDEVFWEYEHNIRKEYRWVPDFVFRRKRVDILRGFLQREQIYQLELFRRKYEGRARHNLIEAISRLEDGSGTA